MKKSKDKENDTLSTFKLRSEHILQQYGKNWPSVSNTPNDEEIVVCIDEVIFPALESVRELLSASYESVAIEKTLISVTLKIESRADSFEFHFTFVGKRKLLSMQWNSKFEYFSHKTLTIIEQTNACEELAYETLADIDREKIIIYFDFIFWDLLDQKDSYIINRRVREKSLDFPY